MILMFHSRVIGTSPVSCDHGMCCGDELMCKQQQQTTGEEAVLDPHAMAGVVIEVSKRIVSPPQTPISRVFFVSIDTSESLVYLGDLHISSEYVLSR